jgi:hypothetical protein
MNGKNDKAALAQELLDQRHVEKREERLRTVLDVLQGVMDERDRVLEQRDEARQAAQHLSTELNRYLDLINWVNAHLIDGDLAAAKAEIDKCELPTTPAAPQVVDLQGTTIGPPVEVQEGPALKRYRFKGTPPCEGREGVIFSDVATVWALSRKLAQEQLEDQGYSDLSYVGEGDNEDVSVEAKEGDLERMRAEAGILLTPDEMEAIKRWAEGGNVLLYVGEDGREYLLPDVWSMSTSPADKFAALDEQGFLNFFTSRPIWKDSESRWMISGDKDSHSSYTGRSFDIPLHPEQTLIVRPGTAE